MFSRKQVPEQGSSASCFPPHVLDARTYGPYATWQLRNNRELFSRGGRDDAGALRRPEVTPPLSVYPMWPVAPPVSAYRCGEDRFAEYPLCTVPRPFVPECPAAHQRQPTLMELQMQIGRECESRHLDLLVNPAAVSGRPAPVAIPGLPRGQRLRAVVADSDGTLVDTVPLIRYGQYQAAKEYLEKHHPELEVPGYERYAEALNVAIGGSTKDTFEKTLKELYGFVQASRIDVAALDKTLNPVQDRIAPECVKAYYGLPDLLRALGEAKVPLAILTSGSKHHVVRNYGVALKGHLGEMHTPVGMDDSARLQLLIGEMKAVFGVETVVVTCDDVARTKPDPQGVQLAMERLGLQDSQGVIMVGDHHVDMQAGCAAGIHAVGVSHGFGTPEELYQGGALAVFDSLVELHLALALGYAA